MSVAEQGLSVARKAPRAHFVHASALVIREHGFLLRGASGSGKSALALALVKDAVRRDWFARIVADDTVNLQPHFGRLVARAHPRTAGLVEQRGLGVRPIVHEPACVLRLVVDLVDPAGLARMPEPEDLTVSLVGIVLPRLTVPAGAPACDNVYRVLDSIAAYRP